MRQESFFLGFLEVISLLISDPGGRFPLQSTESSEINNEI